jgi:hypothetical protein
VVLMWSSSAAAEIPVPAVTDARLEIKLIASEPAIVTPIGMVIDARDRLFVIESHTHRRERDYPGPKHDRVKLFTDTDGDGKRETMRIFADGFHHAMTLALTPHGEVALCHRNGVVILHDRDDDGENESRTTVLKLQTPGDYPHNGLGGLTYSADGWLYVGLGENLGAVYTLLGTDGSKYSGGGEGGSIFRCRLDGSDVQYVATGFWNPFGLTFDRAGNLFCVDNDPDFSPPCRLLHIVKHGDYGYKFRYGRGGLHPFVCWNGEIPGRLPMMAGTGEAPCAILDCDNARLPREYHGNLLVTSWGDYTIDRFQPQPYGASLRAEREILVRGTEAFRPVDITTGPDGAVYINDWADKSYPVHGKGRIWRLTARDGQAVVAPRSLPPLHIENRATARMRSMLRTELPGRYGHLRDALSNPDPFLRAAAIDTLAKPVYRANVLRDARNDQSEVRLGALLALRRAKITDLETLLRNALADPDETVRFAAALWVGEDALVQFDDPLDDVLSAGPVSPRLFHAYLAAKQLLADAPKDTGTLTRGPFDGKGGSGALLIARLLNDASQPASVRALAAAMVIDPDDEVLSDALVTAARTGEPVLRSAAIGTLSASSKPRALSVLSKTARDDMNDPELRADAILALAGRPADRVTQLVDLLDDPSATVRIETVRALTRFADREAVRTALRRRLDAVRDTPVDAELAAQLRFALNPPGTPGRNNSSRPTTDAQWQAALARGGDARSGRRVFFSPLTACAKCHRVGGRGGQVGPDLSVIARSSDRAKLVASILEPSKDMAPKFVPHVVNTNDGDVHIGLLMSKAPDGAITLATAAAETVTIPSDQIAEHRRQTTSLMPDEVENAMTVKDFRDLIKYLLNLK